jgi:hypothetical protein
MPVKAGIVGAIFFGVIAWWIFLAFGLFQSVIAAIVGAAIGYGLFAWVAGASKRRPLRSRGGTMDVTHQRPVETEDEVFVGSPGSRPAPPTGRVVPPGPRPGPVEPRHDPEHREGL